MCHIQLLPQFTVFRKIDEGEISILFWSKSNTVNFDTVFMKNIDISNIKDV
jgi:hypothetical protein